MESKFAVIGLGRFGSKIALTLAERGAEVVAIDAAPERTDALRDDVAYAVTLDSTNIKELQGQRVGEMDAVVVAIGEDFEALLLTTVNLIDLKVKRIIARAANLKQKAILEKMGVHEILSPEDEVGIVVAERLLHPSLMSYLQLPDGYEIAELIPPPGILNKTVEEIAFRNNYDLNLITIKRCYEVEREGKLIKEQHILGVPRNEFVIYDTDTLLLLGTDKAVARFIDANS